jgi:hypothetical protein
MRTDKQLKATIIKMFHHAEPETIHRLVDEVHDDIKQRTAYNIVFDDHESAKAWFLTFCKENNLQTVERYTDQSNKCRLDIKGWGDFHNNPYFMLWMNENDIPHLEIGGSYSDLWDRVGNLKVLTQLMNKVVSMREETA